MIDIRGGTREKIESSTLSFSAFRKNPNNKWYHFNDESVEEVTDLNSLVHTGAYCLFYERI